MFGETRDDVNARMQRRLEEEYRREAESKALAEAEAGYLTREEQVEIAEAAARRAAEAAARQAEDLLTLMRRQDPGALARQAIDVATECLNAFLDGYRSSKQAEMRAHLRDSPEDLRALAAEVAAMRVALEAVDQGAGAEAGTSAGEGAKAGSESRLQQQGQGQGHGHSRDVARAMLAVAQAVRPRGPMGELGGAAGHGDGVGGAADSESIQAPAGVSLGEAGLASWQTHAELACMGPGAVSPLAGRSTVPAAGGGHGGDSAADGGEAQAPIDYLLEEDVLRLARAHIAADSRRDQSGEGGPMGVLRQVQGTDLRTLDTSEGAQRARLEGARGWATSLLDRAAGAVDAAGARGSKLEREHGVAGAG